MRGIVIIDSTLMNGADFVNNSLFYFLNEGNWVRFSWKIVYIQTVSSNRVSNLPIIHLTENTEKYDVFH